MDQNINFGQPSPLSERMGGVSGIQANQSVSMPLSQKLSPPQSEFSEWSNNYKYLYPNEGGTQKEARKVNEKRNEQENSLNISFISPEESPFLKRDTTQRVIYNNQNSTRRRRHVRSSDISVINQSPFQRQNTAQRLTRSFLDKLFRFLESTWIFKWFSKTGKRKRRRSNRNRQSNTQGPQTFGNRFYHGSSRIASSRHESFISSLVDKYIQIRQLARGSPISTNNISGNAIPHQMYPQNQYSSTFGTTTTLGYNSTRSRLANQSDEVIARDIVDRMDRYLGWSNPRATRGNQRSNTTVSSSSSPLSQRTPFKQSFYYNFIIVPTFKIVYIVGFMILYLIVKPFYSLIKFIIRIASSFQT